MMIGKGRVYILQGVRVGGRPHFLVGAKGYPETQRYIRLRGMAFAYAHNVNRRFFPHKPIIVVPQRKETESA
jgi:hypothetical protein